MTQEIAKYNVHTKAHKRKLIKRWLIAIVVLAIIIWAFAGVPSLELKSKSLEILKSIFSGLFHPDISYIYIPDGEDLLRGLLETFAIAVVGTFIAAIICIPLAFLGANNMVKLRPVSGVSKFILSVIRVFPEIVMALIFIKAVGPGSFSGVLALGIHSVGIHSVGMLGKLLAEDIEGLDFSAVESLKASGANKIKTLVFAVIPQIMPAFLSLILYRFELNLRSASILGLIGAGGIGTPLIFAIQTRSWDRVGIILIGLVLMVAIVDLISGSIRKRIV
ncbi:TPA: phosphonate ABC transporter, permease protein PhnE [Staphylococcus aureus]|nr:phosphonate ABC transporter, permease protein PhnE [Staphylococcus aureus]